MSVGNSSLLGWGDASTLSFHATKVFHTIEGGAIVFKRKEDFQTAKRIINFGIDHDGMASRSGINAKLSEYQCAVGLAMLHDIDEIIDHRVSLFDLYVSLLKDYVSLPVWRCDASLNGAYFPILLADKKRRENVKSRLHEKGIASRDYFSLHLIRFLILTKNVLFLNQSVREFCACPFIGI